MAAILARTIKAGDVLVIRYEGPKGGPGMQEMLAPTSALVGQGLGESVALVTDGRFTGQLADECPGLDLHVRPPTTTTPPEVVKVLTSLGFKTVGFESRE